MSGRDPSYTQQCLDSAIAYLRVRGVLMETFKKCEGEIDPFISRDKIAERLNRPPSKFTATFYSD